VKAGPWAARHILATEGQYEGARTLAEQGPRPSLPGQARGARRAHDRRPLRLARRHEVRLMGERGRAPIASST
jgi:hypothetical protein